MADIFSLAQVLGYIAFAGVILAFWQKRDKSLLLLNALSAVFWTAHYVLLGAWVGAATEGLVAIRSYLSAYMTDVRHKHIAAGVFSVAFIVAGILAWHYWYDAFTIIACLIGTISMIYLQGLNLRYGMLISTILWLVYNGIVGSIGGSMAGLILVTTQITTIIRIYRDQRIKA